LAIHGFIRTWTKNHRQKINPGIKEAIAELSGKYRLALAGNQPSDVRKELDEHGILKSFALTKVSEDIGIAKPDPKFFEYILDKIAVKPKQSVMVGDRLDNDIIPAKKLGLKTILVKAGPYAILKPGTKDENPDAIIYSVTELPRTVETLSLG
jgi:HAD superfamily hydrolase (TIGR01509 family)